MEFSKKLVGKVEMVLGQSFTHLEKIKVEPSHKTRWSQMY